MHEVTRPGVDIKELAGNLLNKLYEEELHWLHHQVTDRLNELQRLNARERMMQFNAGDRVLFQHNSETVVGVVIRLNQKTVSVHADDHRNWRVSPSFLRKIVPSA